MTWLAPKSDKDAVAQMIIGALMLVALLIEVLV
ncbi:hypothetical protein AEYBE204_13045 [Asticcacaulis sp. YBE204]|nr:hypothetical protein AEYBE204_13045 [Asticcacaulis sp. YBE204]